MTSYVYKQTEPELWTVGYFDPDGTWCPEHDHSSRGEAAARVRFLNGGPASPPARYFYWIAFFAQGSFGAVEVSQDAPLAYGDHVDALQNELARRAGLPSVAITSFTLLRIEGTDGQVIG